MRLLQGVYTAMLTPFSQSGEICTEALDSYLAFQAQHGIHGLVVSGTNGEGTSLSMNERMRLLEAVADRWPKDRVVAATATSSLPEAVELTEHAASVGVLAIMALPPYYYKRQPIAGVTSFFRSLLDMAKLPVYLYNIPQHTAIDPIDECLVELADHPMLFGMKDSQGDWNKTEARIKQYPRLQILTGADELAPKVLAMGSQGMISGGANPFPELAVEVFQRSMQGDSAAGEVFAKSKQILMRYPLISAGKAVVQARGIADMRVRPPLVELSNGQRGTLLAELAESGYPVTPDS